MRSFTRQLPPVRAALRPGVTLHQVDSGPPARPVGAVPIVLLHALGCDLRVWDAVAVPLAEHYRVIRYDLRGHGRSTPAAGSSTIEDHVRDLEVLLAALGLRRVILAGLSVGGLIALTFASQAPERVERLVLCASADRIGTGELWERRIAAIRERGLDGMADEIVSRWFAPAFAAREPATVNEHRERLRRSSPDGYLSLCAALRAAAAGSPPDLTRLRQPVLLLSGEHDVAVPGAAMDSLARRLPWAEYRPIPGAAHLPPVEQPAAVLAALRQFLPSTTPPHA